MHLNFTDKNYGTTDLLDDANGQLRYTIRSSVDGKMNTVRRPAQESSPDARGLFIARIHRHAITSDKVELQEGERSKAKEWMQEEGHGYAKCTFEDWGGYNVLFRRTFTTRSGRKYTWLSRQHGDAAVSRLIAERIHLADSVALSAPRSRWQTGGISA